MIIPVKKAQLFVFNNQKEATLKLLQRHAFFMLTENHQKPNVENQRIKDAERVIELLKPHVKKSFGSDFIEIDQSSFDEIDENVLSRIPLILSIGDKIDAINEKMNQVKAKMSLIKPYLNLDIPNQDIKKIKTIDTIFGSVDHKNGEEFIQTLERFGSQYEVFDTVDKQTYFVVATLKQRFFLNELKLSGLNNELPQGTDLLQKLDNLNSKIQKFEEQKKQALQIINQLAKKKVDSKEMTVNESTIHNVLALANERQSLRNDIAAFKQEISQLKPFESLTLSLKKLDTSELLETKFAKVRLKSKGYNNLKSKAGLSLTNFSESKTHAYVGLTYLKDLRDQVLEGLTDIEFIELEKVDLIPTELIKQKESSIQNAEARLEEILTALNQFRAYADEISKVTSMHNVLKQEILEIISMMSHEEIFKAFKFKLMDLLQLGYIKLYVENVTEDSLVVKTVLSQTDLLRIILGDYRFNQIEMPNYAQKNQLIYQAYLNDSDQLAEEKAKLELELANESENIAQYKILYDQLVNKHNLNQISYAQTTYTEYLEGWIIESKVDALKKSLDQAEIIYELDLVEPEEGEVVPTAFKNNKLVQPFESITNTFSPPASNEVDPNPSMSVWYWIIFGLMMGDIGYGLIMMIGCFLFLKLLKPKGGTKSLLTVFGFSGLSTVVAGILYGSFFGYEIGILPPEYTLSLMEKPLEMLIFCLALGVLHIITGLVLKCINLVRDGDILGMLGDGLSWILVLLGIGIAVIPGIPYGMTIGVVVALTGAALVVLFTAHAKKNVITRTLFGIIGLYNATSFLGDILSYSRILALALSGAVIGSTMNLLAEMMFPMGFMGYIFAGLIYIGGHIFNLAMNLLSAYVHAGRLQYLEFFGKFYNGGGILFNPYQLNLKYVYSIKNKEN
ncbi:hypothetical protein JV173_00745 [Acholeplasma equirhinis]|uniref:V-type ATPase 116kDa subunit family protein n=1 Tax=Acholeplasma equirhinis TaxID=555393 RepID=UPI00197AD22F|nr:V-type ATPase 116kDa subunit family protein [Acholeplasma equirhinis]MBN3490032.1 hypothetical protein [Acholeplasma equirhinis]